MAVRYKTKSPFGIVFQFYGSVWPSVLPYCLINVIWSNLIVFAKSHGIYIAFSGEGHGLVGLLVSFLVINKVYIALARYMEAREYMGRALSNMRELNQVAITFTETLKDDSAKAWRDGMKTRIIEVIDSTIISIRSEERAVALARNECKLSCDEDPMTFVQSLRSHLYTGSLTLGEELQLLERCKMLDMLNAFVYDYRSLLKIASTPLPFPMMQMGRTFLFLWLFSMPLALVNLEVSYVAVTEFVIFLTYGYLGLELVGLEMLHPFGDGTNDLNVTGMRDATVIGINNDSSYLEGAEVSVPQKLRKHPSDIHDMDGIPYRSLGDALEGSFYGSQLCSPLTIMDHTK